MAIARFARSANNTNVKLSDGSTMPLTEFLASPGALTITGYARGAGNPTIKDSAGTTTGLAQHYFSTVNKAPAQTIAEFTRTAAANSVEDDNGDVMNVVKYQASTDGVAVAEAPEEDDNGGAVVVTGSKANAKKIKSQTAKATKKTK